MVSLIRLHEIGEDGLAVALDGPVELTAVDEDAAHGGTGAGVELRGGGDDDVGAEFQRANKRRGGDRVVDDERNMVLVSDLGDGWDIEDVSDGVAEGLTVESLGIRLDGLLPLGRVIRVLEEGDVDAQALQGDGEQGGGATVKARGGDDVVAGRSDVEDGGGLSGLAGRESHGGDAAFQGCDAALEGVHRRVGQASVNRACIREVKASGSVLGAVEDVGRRLVNRNVARVRRAIQILPYVEGTGFDGPVGEVGVVIFRSHARNTRPSCPNVAKDSRSSAHFTR